MFLNPTAKPVPRRTPSPRVVLPGAAGKPKRIARKRLGGGRLEPRRLADHLATGSEPSITWPGRKRVARRERVQEAELDRIDAERVGELVHLGLAGEARLNRAEAAHRAARRVVRVHHRRLDQRVRHQVGAELRRTPRCGRRRSSWRRTRRRRAGSSSRTETSRPSCVARCSAQIRDGWRCTWPDERLLAVVDDLHRPVRVQREQRPVDLHRQVLASPERSSHAAEVHAHLLERQRETGRDLGAIDVQPLSRDVDVDSSLAVRHREARLRARGTPGPGSRARRRRSRRRRPATSGSPCLITMWRTTFGRSSSR